jgi:hypothetical protein
MSASHLTMFICLVFSTASIPMVTAFAMRTMPVLTSLLATSVTLQPPLAYLTMLAAFATDQERSTNAAVLTFQQATVTAMATNSMHWTSAVAIVQPMPTTTAFVMTSTTA